VVYWGVVVRILDDERVASRKQLVGQRPLCISCNRVTDNYSHDSHTMGWERNFCEVLCYHCLAMSPVGSDLSCKNALN
jgi:hypothetical protein